MKSQTVTPQKSPNQEGRPPQPATSHLPAFLQDVEVHLEARLGGVAVTVAELASISPGSVMKLDHSLSDPIELRLNGAVVAWGEIVVVDDYFGVRIVEVAELK